MQKKLFFSDIDGTLLRSDGTISDTLADALRSLAASGHSLILTSGRPLHSIMGVQEYLNQTLGLSFDDSFIIANNGALIYDCAAGKPVFEKTIPMEDVDILQHAAQQLGIHIQTYTKDAIVCRQQSEEINYYRRRIKLPLLTGEKFTDILSEEPYKMLAISLSGIQQLLPLKDYIETSLPDRVQAIFSIDHYMELIHKDAGKGKALAYLCDYLSVPLKNSFAAGDSENDISMLRAAGCGYAMACGDDRVKSSADRITSLDCEHDGLLEIIDAMLQT